MLDKRIKFRHLQCFLTVAQQGSVVAAANRLSLTQPAVSKTIRELEEVLDVELIDRSRRTRHLTPFGEIFLRHAASSVTALQSGIHGIQRARERIVSQIGAGVSRSIAVDLLPRAIERFTTHQPDTLVRVTSADNATLLENLRWGSLDVAIAPLESTEGMSGLDFESLHADRLSLAVRPDHPLLSRGSIDLARLASYMLILPPEGSTARALVERLFITHRLPRRGHRIETASNVFGRAYTAATDAVWVTFYSTVASEIANGGLAELPIDDCPAANPVGLITRSHSPPSIPVQALARAIRHVAIKLAAEVSAVGCTDRAALRAAAGPGGI